ncbi:MAG: YraN family protein [Eubacteriales bacterium]|nr:YraN family protein [Eubacteriales bacterium]
MNRRTIGSTNEQKAAEFLEKQGMQIIARNYRIRSGEIDLIAKDGAYLVFIEVKYRASERRGTPLEAVNVSKQKVIVRTARHFMMKYGYHTDTPCRFDVIGILGDQIQYIKNAFWC